MLLQFFSLFLLDLLFFFHKKHNNDNHSRANLLSPSFFSVTVKLLRCGFFSVEFFFEVNIDDWNGCLWNLNKKKCLCTDKKRSKIHSRFSLNKIILCLFTDAQILKNIN